MAATDTPMSSLTSDSLTWVTISPPMRAISLKPKVANGAAAGSAPSTKEKVAPGIGVPVAAVLAESMYSPLAGGLSAAARSAVKTAHEEIDVRTKRLIACMSYLQ